MGVDMKVKAIYDSEIGNITRSEKNWKDVLKVAGQLYRYEFDNIGLSTLFQTNFFRLFFRYCTGV